MVLLSTAATAWEVVTVPATRKVVPTSTVGYPTYTSATLEGARNEWESFQIIVKSDTPVSGINVTVSELSGAGDNSIASSNIKLYREWFLNITAPSGGGWGVTNHERVAGLYPDPLIPFVDPYSAGNIPVAAPFALTADDPGLAVVFVDIYIPTGTLPGIYTGTATVTATDKADVVIPITLAVWELDTPAERTIGTAYGLSEGAIREYHGNAEGGQTSENYADIIRNYYVAMHENRLDPQGFGGDVSFNFDGDGALLPVDFTAYDDHMTKYIDGSYFPDGVGIARFNAGRFAPGSGTGAWTDDQYKLAAKAYVEHLDDKGWLDRMWTYSTDEPWLNGGTETWNKVIRDATLLHEASPLWKGKVLVTGPMYPGAEEVVDIWCPVNPMYDKWFWVDNDYPGRGGYDEHFAKGGELWFYNCNGNFPPYAGYDTDATIGYEPRILKWGSFFEKATGFLFWHMNFWGPDPWIQWQRIDVFGEIFARNGDGLLLYPGDANGTNAAAVNPANLHLNGPIVSYRMKQIRDGLEDWEMFILAEKAGLGDWLRTEMSNVYLRFGDFFTEDCATEHYYCPQREPWTLDENVLYETRHRIAMKLLFTMYPDRYPDPDAPVIVEEVEQVETVETAEIVDSDVVVTPDIAADSGRDSTGTDTTVASDTGASTDTVGTDTGHPDGGSGCSTTPSPTSPAPLLLLVILTGLIFAWIRRSDLSREPR